MQGSKQVNIKIYNIASIALVMLLSGCVQNNESAAQYEKLTKDMSVLKEQLQLITKEVVNISKKLDSTGLQKVADQNKQEKIIDLESRLGKTVRLGSKDAKVAIVEFMDYQCPYCIRHAKQVFPKILKKYVDTGLVQYVVRDFPLDFHTQGKNSAQAAKCAQEQNQFLSMHKLLVENSRSLNVDAYPQFAQSIGIEMDAFSTCMKDSKIRQFIDQDIAYGIKIGVSGTPRFYLGKVSGDQLVDVTPISGAASLSTFDNVLNRLLN